MTPPGASGGAPAAGRIAVIGAGWAGLAAAVEAADRGLAVTLFEMASRPGGRARRVDSNGLALDNGQHILIGAYAQTLALLRRVGVDPARSLQRLPLRLRHADGSGLALPAGPAPIAFARGVLAADGWRLRDKLALLATATGWACHGFRCAATLSVAELAAPLPRRVREDLIEPLCVAALNTPARRASATVFLRVLRDGLFGGPGASDLLLPVVDLSGLWPEAAVSFLRDRGASLRCAIRVGTLSRAAGTPGWAVDGEPFDGVVLATSAVEAARLVRPHAPAWAEGTAALRHEPIVTVVACATGARLPEPMLALRTDSDAPAQFVFDLGRLRGMDGMLAFVVSGAGDWVARGLDVTARAVLRQAGAALQAFLPQQPALVRVFAEKRATFLCTPGLERPAAAVAAGLVAAGDYVAGPYPATLEGAMRSGVEAADAIAAATATVSGGRKAQPAVRR